MQIIEQLKQIEKLAYDLLQDDDIAEGYGDDLEIIWHTSLIYQDLVERKALNDAGTDIIGNFILHTMPMLNQLK